MNEYLTSGQSAHSLQHVFELVILSLHDIINITQSALYIHYFNFKFMEIEFLFHDKFQGCNLLV